jgi:hypothetical protein
MEMPFVSLAAQTRLIEGIAERKRELNRAYLMKMKPENLLLSHYIEAGLAGRINYKLEGIHWGWDSPLSDIRGTLCGHWLSAAAHIVRELATRSCWAGRSYRQGNSPVPDRQRRPLGVPHPGEVYALAQGGS